jgi:hypothetical protein
VATRREWNYALFALVVDPLWIVYASEQDDESELELGLGLAAILDLDGGVWLTGIKGRTTGLCHQGKLAFKLSSGSSRSWFASIPQAGIKGNSGIVGVGEGEWKRKAGECVIEDYGVNKEIRN